MDDKAKKERDAFISRAIVEVLGQNILFAVLIPFVYFKFEIPIQHVAFCIGFPVYLILANKFCFNSNELQLSMRNEEYPGVYSLGKGYFVNKPAFELYKNAFSVFTFILPMILAVLGPEEVSTLIISPLTMLFVLILFEQTTESYHDVLRILTPLGFNAYRYPTLIAWTTESWKMWQSVSSDDETYTWYTINIVVSTINITMWSYHFFGFLLLRLLPLYFDEKDTPPIEMAYTMFPIPKKKGKSA